MVENLHTDRPLAPREIQTWNLESEAMLHHCAALIQQAFTDNFFLSQELAAKQNKSRATLFQTIQTSSIYFTVLLQVTCDTIKVKIRLLQ